MSAQPLLILGIGTDIGKTFVIEKLCQKNPQAKAIKPVATGFDASDENCDTMRIIKALKKNNQNYSISQISPFVFSEPTSPHLAGNIDYQALLDFCKLEINKAYQRQIQLFIESAGGVMTPINYNKTFLDLTKDLFIEVLLVASNYLGAISHTLSCIEVLKLHNIKIKKIIINDGLSAKQNFFKNYQDLDFEIMATTLIKFSNLEVVKIDDL